MIFAHHRPPSCCICCSQVISKLAITNQLPLSVRLRQTLDAGALLRIFAVRLELQKL
jgi:hypothetical protein